MLSSRSVCLASLLVIVSLSAAEAAEPLAADFFVAPGGNDRWSGRLPLAKPDGSDGPLATLAAARDAVRRWKAGRPLDRPIRILVRGGTYRLREPVVFTAEDSGTAEAPIIYAAWPGEKPIFSGGEPVTGWKKVDGPLVAAFVPAVKDAGRRFRQLFVAGRRATPARIPNDGVFRAAGPGVPYQDRNAARGDPKTKVSLHYNGEDLKPWLDLDDAVVVVYHSWTTSRHRIKSLDVDKKLVQFTAPSAWPMGWWEKNERYYIESVRAGLDAPGEWHLDRRSGLLTYYPRPGEKPGADEVVAPRTEELLRLEGDPAAGKFVEYLRFDGLSFQHTRWVMPEAEVVDGQAAAFLKTAAVFARGARHCRLERCEIAHTGGYALWLEQGCQDNRVAQCHIHDTGAGGVRIGQSSLPDEEPLRTERNEIDNCFIHDGGHVYHAGVGVWIGKSSYNRVRHNEICDFFYTGVSVGWSWGYAPSSAHHNLIESNHIHHLGWAQLSDMGGIYCLGLAPGTRLVHNRIHDVLSYSYGGWGLYTDEGSTGVVMENNIVYRVKDGAFHQHYGRDNVLRNNVLAFSATRGQIIRSRQEEHRSFTVERNIILCEPAPPLGGNWTNGNFLFAKNVYWKRGQPPTFPGGLSLRRWQEKGQDAGSVFADPKFADPDHYDFRLPEDSPALKLGFRPIDADTIGLTGPEAWVKLPKQIKRPAMKMPGEE